MIGSTGINSSQAITLIGFVISVGALLYRHRIADFAAAKAADDADDDADEMAEGLQPSAT